MSDHHKPPLPPLGSMLGAAGEILDRRLDRLEAMLGAIHQEVMQVSTENEALAAATAALENEISDVTAVDNSIAGELVQLHEALGKINPTDPAQVNAVTAATERLTSITAALKAAGDANAPAAEAGAASADAGGAAAPDAGAPAPDAAPDAGAAEPVLVVHTAQDAIDESVFVPTDKTTAGDSPQPLYAFAGDPSTLDPAAWSVYSGEVVSPTA